MKRKQLVVIESPYAGDVERNVLYARRALADSLHRGEAPFASHLLYTQEGVLDDDIQEERVLGIEAGFAWGRSASLVAVYRDYGITRGMRSGIEFASLRGAGVEFRNIGENPA